MRQARRIRVLIGEDERFRGRPLFEAIVLAARDQGLAGATVFRGFIGYAPHADIATAGIVRLAENMPVVVDIVDEKERIDAFLPFLEQSVKTGVVLASDVLAEQVLPEKADQPANEGRGAPDVSELTEFTRARVYLRDSAAFEGSPAHEVIVRVLREENIRDVSVHHGIMGFDRSSGLLSSRPLRFHADLPVVVEAVGGREQIVAALPGIREVLERGLITLTGVEFCAPACSRTD